jgi:hypothetical protein
VTLTSGGELTSNANIVSVGKNGFAGSLTSLDLQGGTFTWTAGALGGPLNNDPTYFRTEAPVTVESGAKLVYNNVGATSSVLGFAPDIKGTFEFDGTTRMDVYLTESHITVESGGLLDLKVSGVSDTVGGIGRATGTDYSYIDNKGTVKQEGRSINVKEPLWNDGGLLDVDLQNIQFFGSNSMTGNKSIYQTGANAQTWLGNLSATTGSTLYGDQGIYLENGYFRIYGQEVTDTLQTGTSGAVSFGSFGIHPLAVYLGDSTHADSLNIQAGTEWDWNNGSINYEYEGSSGYGSKITVSGGNTDSAVFASSGLSMTFTLLGGGTLPGSWPAVKCTSGQISAGSSPAPDGYTGAVEQIFQAEYDLTKKS